MQNLTQTKHREWSCRTLWLVAAALFIASFLIRGYLAIYDKKIVVYYDELRYYDIARSLAEQGKIMVRGTPSNYSKILYPLLITPAFWFSNITTQLRVVGLIGAAWVSSSVFPALLLAKKSLKRPASILFLMLFTLIVPDLAYSMTFMSETTSFPLTLWLLYFMWQAFDAPSGQRPLLRGGLTGLLAFALYLNKEMALALLISFFLCAALQFFTQPATRRGLVLLLSGFAAGFLLPHLATQFTVFRGMGSSYSQTGFGILSSPAHVAYLFYAAASLTIFMLLAFLYFPVIWPLVSFERLNSSQRRLFLLSLGTLLISIATIAFTITIRENYGMAVPRQHLRYYTPVLIPLLTCCLHLQEAAPEPKSKASSKPFILWLVAISTVSTFIFIGPLAPAIIDNTLLNLFAYFSAYGSHIVAGTFVVNLPVLFYKLLFILFLSGGSLLLIRRHTKALAIWVLLPLTGLMVANSIFTVGFFHNNYGIIPEAKAEILALQEALEDTPGQVLILHEHILDDKQRALDTYLTLDAVYARADILLETEGPSIEVSTLAPYLDYIGYYKEAPPPSGLTYVLVVGHNYALTEASAELIPFEALTNYTLYRLTGDSFELVKLPELE